MIDIFDLMEKHGVIDTRLRPKKEVPVDNESITPSEIIEPPKAEEPQIEEPTIEAPSVPAPATS